MVYGVSVDFDCISNSDDSCELINSDESCYSNVFFRNLLIPVNLVISGIKFILLNQINLVIQVYMVILAILVILLNLLLFANQMLLVNVTMT